LSRESRDLTDAERRRALVLAVPEGVLYAGMVGCAETWFVADAIRLGASALEQGLTVGLPLFIGALGPLLVLRWLARGARRKGLTVGCVAAQALTMVAMALADWSGRQTPALVILGSCVYQICGQGSAPVWSSWFADLVPETIRGTYFARRTRAVQFTISFSMVGAGIVLQLLEPRTFLAGVTTAWWPEHAAAGRGFAIVFGAAALSRSLSTLLLALSPEPPFKGLATTTKVLQFLNTTRGSNAWRLVAGSGAFYLCVYLSSPFVVPFVVEELRFSYVWLMAALAIHVLMKAIFQSRFGGAIDRHGPRTVWVLAALACAVMPLPFIWAGTLPPAGHAGAAGGSSAAVPWGGLWILTSQAFSGMAWGCFEIAVFVLILETTFRATRPHAVAAQSILNGFGQLAGSLLGGLFLALSSRAFRWLFVVSIVARVVMAFVLPRLVRERPDRPSIGARALLLRVVGIAPGGTALQGYAPPAAFDATAPPAVEPGRWVEADGTRHA
jgi:MFS family permease